MSIFAVLLLLFFIGDVLWAFHVVRHLRSPVTRGVAAFWGLAMFAGLAVIVGGRFAGTSVDDLLPRAVLSVLFIWHLLIIPPWLIFRLVLGLSGAVRRLRPRAPAVEETAEGMSRRDFLAAATPFAPAILATGAAGLAEAQLQEFRVRRIEAPIANLPPALDGLTIAQVSDVHVGRFTRGSVLERIVSTTNDLAPDLAVLTGDLINHAMRDLPAGIDLARGLRAKHGVYLCEGNHDLFEDPAGFRRQVLRSGLALLRDEGTTIEARGEKVQLLGMRWAHGDSGHERAIAELAKQKVPGAFPILLAHHPHAFDFAGAFPLTFAGHTHGGQLMANPEVGFGPWMFRYWSGLYQRDGRAMIVSNGVGNWFPIRIGAPAEIVHVTLRRAS